MATTIFGARAPPPTPTDHHTCHPEFRGVQFAPRGLVINVPNNLSTQIEEEIHMYIRTTVIGAWSVLGAAIAASTLFAGGATAKEVTVAIQVNAQGLDLSQPAGAHALYARIQHAAWVVCTHGMRVDLQPSPDPEGCYEKALGDAIRSANVPRLTQVYLATHTLREAAARGIDVPALTAAK
jgi:UrcA family protein